MAHALVAAAGEAFVTVVPHDAYYRAQPHLAAAARAAANYDEPAAFDTTLLLEHLDALRRGQAVERPVYDFAAFDRTDRTLRLAPTPVVVVEGILVLADRELRRRFDVKVFVDAPPDERFIRRLERDVRERGRTAESVIDQYRRTVKPMHDRHCEPSKRHADLIVPEGGANRPALAVLRGFVRDVVRLAPADHAVPGAAAASAGARDLAGAE
ncbi:MAG: uridine kinase [Trueperaceae bacterium]